MGKRLMTIFFCFSLFVAAETKEDIDTTDIRKYHQQLEERVFEIEEKENQDEKIREAFLHGKRRIKDAVRNEKAALESEGKETSEKLEELLILEKKYDEIFNEYEKISEEKKNLISENKFYEEQLKKEKKVEK